MTAPESDTEITVDARAISRSFGSHAAVREVDLTLRRGEVLGLLGPNGAGKTTTMQMLTGNLAPSAGSIAICGRDLIDEPVAAKRHIGYLPEQPPLYRDLTVDEYLGLAARLHRVPRARVAAAVDTAKTRCGLADTGRKLIGTLSRGFQQRVGIAQALVHEPDVVILDEPTVGLDPNQIREIRALIRELAAGRTIVLSTHILSEVEAVCDRVEIMHEGRLVYGDAIAALDARARGRQLHLALRHPPEIATLAAVNGVAGVEPVGDGVFLVNRDPEVDPTAALVTQSVADGWGLYEIGPAHTRLEDVFMRLTRSGTTA